MVLLVKYQKFTLFDLRELFYLNKLRNTLFSWHISFIELSECGKLYFLLLFITKYFITIYIYQIIFLLLVCVCVCVCVRANWMLLTLSVKIDQGLPCERYRISRSSGKPL